MPGSPAACCDVAHVAVPSREGSTGGIEEQLSLLQECVPEWISEKTALKWSYPLLVNIFPLMHECFYYNIKN
jgi:hypothetical protein